jgi:hypothetical protein
MTSHFFKPSARQFNPSGPAPAPFSFPGYPPLPGPPSNHSFSSSSSNSAPQQPLKPSANTAFSPTRATRSSGKAHDTKEVTASDEELESELVSSCLVFSFLIEIVAIFSSRTRMRTVWVRTAPASKTMRFVLCFPCKKPYFCSGFLVTQQEDLDFQPEDRKSSSSGKGSRKARTKQSTSSVGNFEPTSLAPFYPHASPAVHQRPTPTAPALANNNGNSNLFSDFNFAQVIALVLRYTTIHFAFLLCFRPPQMLLLEKPCFLFKALLKNSSLCSATFNRMVQASPLFE